MKDPWGWTAQRAANGYLALADGSVFRGRSVGAPEDRVGEAVFNTAMSGYQEILSDPSYSGQFVCLTAPEIGIVGANPADMESSGGQAEGLLAHRISPTPSNWRSQTPLPEWLRHWRMPALDGIDTRALTLRLRDHGSQKAFLCASGTVPEAEGVERARMWRGLDGQDCATRVTCAEPYEWADEQAAALSGFGGIGADPTPPVEFRVAVYDFGVKRSLLRCLRRAGTALTVVPAQTPAETVMAMKPDGVFLSNGPGDPAGLGYAVAAVRGLLGRVPLMGVCLGHQLLGLACGAVTRRLPFGHHGGNHPVRDNDDGRVFISSQNHNFAVAAETVDPNRVDITHLNLNDNSVEGLRCRDVPAFSVQFHPEAAPGPLDAVGLFARFRAMMAAFKQ